MSIHRQAFGQRQHDRFCRYCGGPTHGRVKDPHTGELLVEVDIVAVPDDVAISACWAETAPIPETFYAEHLLADSSVSPDEAALVWLHRLFPNVSPLTINMTYGKALSHAVCEYGMFPNEDCVAMVLNEVRYTLECPLPSDLCTHLAMGLLAHALYARGATGAPQWKKNAR